MNPTFESIEQPTLLLDEAAARRNIRFMAEKATRLGLVFRPHFKTHQSAVIGEWFRDNSARSYKAILVFGSHQLIHKSALQLPLQLRVAQSLLIGECCGVGRMFLDQASAGDRLSKAMLVSFLANLAALLIGLIVFG